MSKRPTIESPCGSAASDVLPVSAVSTPSILIGRKPPDDAENATPALRIRSLQQSALTRFAPVPLLDGRLENLANGNSLRASVKQCCLPVSEHRGEALLDGR